MTEKSKIRNITTNIAGYMSKKAAKLGGITMPDSIDVRGLDEQDVSLIETLVKRLREKKRKKKEAKGKEETTLASWPLGVKGKLTRKEIYEDL